MSRALISIFFITWLSAALTVNAHEYIKLEHSKGTMSAGGIFSFPIEWDPVRKTAFLFNLSPEFGIFLSNNFQLLTRAHLKSAFYTNGLQYGARDSLWHWGIGLGAKYFFPVKWPVIPFVALGFDVGISKLNLTTTTGNIDFPLGVLVPVNEVVAFSFGISTSVFLVARRKVLDRIRFEPGCLGVIAFF